MSNAVGARLAYVELPVTDSEGDVRASSRRRSAGVSPVSARAMPGRSGRGADLGLDADRSAQPAAPLPGIVVTDLEAALAAVEAAGAPITRPIFAFPGGRRFQFREPGGNELAVFVEEPGPRARHLPRCGAAWVRLCITPRLSLRAASLKRRP